MLPTDTQQMSADAGREFSVQARLSYVVMEEMGGNKGGEYYSGGKEEGRRFQLTFRCGARSLTLGDLSDARQGLRLLGSAWNNKLASCL